MARAYALTAFDLARAAEAVRATAAGSELGAAFELALFCDLFDLLDRRDLLDWLERRDVVEEVSALFAAAFLRWQRDFCDFFKVVDFTSPLADIAEETSSSSKTISSRFGREPFFCWRALEGQVG